MSILAKIKSKRRGEGPKEKKEIETGDGHKKTCEAVNMTLE